MASAYCGRLPALLAPDAMPGPGILWKRIHRDPGRPRVPGRRGHEIGVGEGRDAFVAEVPGAVAK